MDVQPLIIKEKFKGGIQNNSTLLTNGVKRLACIGGSGSGKTTWLTRWWLPMIHKPIGGITVVAKNQEQDQYKCIEHYCKKEKIPYTMLEEFTMDDFQSLREDDTPCLVIYDDLANTDNMDALLGVSKYGRVRHIYLCVVGQDYKSIPREVRQNITSYAVFPCGAAHAARSMISGLSAWVNEENLKKAYKFICKPQNKYAMILIQTDGRSVIMNKDGDIWDLNNFQSIALDSRDNKKKGKQKKEETYSDDSSVTDNDSD
jgi:hypothetical protein